MSSEEYSNEEESESTDAIADENSNRGLGVFGNHEMLEKITRSIRKKFETSDMSLDAISLDGVNEDKHYEYLKNALPRCMARIRDLDPDRSYICRINGKLEIIPYEKLKGMHPFTQRMAHISTATRKCSFLDEETIKTITKKFPVYYLLDRRDMIGRILIYTMAEAKKLVEDQK